MKAAEFNTWMEAVDRLSDGQRNRLREKLDECEVGLNSLEVPESGSIKDMVCPRCAGRKIYRWGKSCNLPRYMCRSCKRTFSPLTNTPLAGLPHKDKLLDYEQVLAQGSIKKARGRRGVAILSGGSVICVYPRFPDKKFES